MVARLKLSITGKYAALHPATLRPKSADNIFPARGVANSRDQRELHVRPTLRCKFTYFKFRIICSPSNLLPPKDFVCIIEFDAIMKWDKLERVAVSGTFYFYLVWGLLRQGGVGGGGGVVA